MKDDAVRIASYIAKTTPTTVGLKVAARLSGMKTGFNAAIPQFVADEIAAQGILNGLGVYAPYYPLYYDFVRQMSGMVYQGMAGASLLAEATNLHAKYVTGYGLATATVKKLAEDIFGVIIP